MHSSTMEYRPLPGTDLSVSAVSLGTLGFCRGKCSAEEMAEMTERALDRGVNFIDTAYAYGRGTVEEAIGPVIERRRDEVAVLTRGHLREPDEFREAFEGSFERLRTDTIDLFELHDVSTPDLYEKVMSNGIYDTAREAQEAGRTGAVGISSHGPGELLETIIASGRFRVVTVAYNLTGVQRSSRDGERISGTAERIIPLAYEHGVGITVMKPFGGGVILQAAPDGTRLTPAECIRYVLANPMVSTVSPGVNDREQLEAILDAWHVGESLSDRERAELERKGQAWGQYFCRRCGYCLPCEQDIDIPRMMQFYEQFRATGQSARAGLQKRFARFETPPSACIECGVCEERCPYSLPIMVRLRELAETFIG